MDYQAAMQKRRSQRRYTDQPIAQGSIEALEASIAEYNRKTGLHMQLVLDEPEVFSKFKTSYGIFKGVRNYIALVGKANDPNRMENEGRYGELLVLRATDMGLATCWLGTSYDRESCGCDIAEDEILDLVIAVGHATPAPSFREKMFANMMHRGDKDLGRLTNCDAEPPAWFNEGMKAVAAAPSTKNLRPYVFSYRNGEISMEGTGDFERAMVDVGIAKVHFELGAGRGSFEMGSPAVFSREL